MNQFEFLWAASTFFLIGMIAVMVMITFIEPKDSYAEDFNILKNNDIELANLIYKDSQALQYLNTCRIVEDNNYTQTLLCVKEMKR